MIRAFIESLMGSFGRAIFRIYEQYSLVINGLIILYALSVFLAHQTFRSMFNEIVKQLPLEDGKEIGKEKLKALIDQSELDWKAILKAAWFPFIAIPGKIAIHFKSEANSRRIFCKDNLMTLLSKPDQDKKVKATGK